MVRKILLVLAAGVLGLCLWAAVTPQGLASRARILSGSSAGHPIPVTGPNAFQGCSGGRVEEIRPDFEQKVVELTNQVRAARGLAPLKRVPELDEAARYHAADMNHDDYFDHNTFDRDDEGGLIASCDTWRRMESYYPLWNAMGENIAAGQRTPEMALEGWMNSPEHYENMMSASYWEMGAGYYEGQGSFRYYWDQNFGRRHGHFPVIINLEAAQTTSQEVQVYVHGDWDQMRVRVDDGPWSRWMDFQREFPISLPNVPGEHTVWVDLRFMESSARSSDSIELMQSESSHMSRWFLPFMPPP